MINIHLTMLTIFIFSIIILSICNLDNMPDLMKEILIFIFLSSGAYVFLEI